MAKAIATVKPARIPAGGKFRSRNPEAAERFADTGGVRGTVIQAVKTSKRAITAAEVAKALDLTEQVAKRHLNRATVDGFISRKTVGKVAQYTRTGTALPKKSSK